MLRQTFCHLPGIGPTTERRLWDEGIRCWSDLSVSSGHAVPRSQVDRLTRQNDRYVNELELGNACAFARSLPSNQHWRIFPEFRDKVAFLDIETTGLGSYGDYITTIALYDGATIRHYVHGQNIDDFVDDIEQYSLIVTYNGKCFDVPFIERQFGIRLGHAHIDLRFVLKSLGYSGGLKSCEKQLGLDRDELDGIDGYFAVVLWAEYMQNQNESALQTLLAYNVQDVLTLETLMTFAYNEQLKATPFVDELELIQVNQPSNPFQPDMATVHRLLNRHSMVMDYRSSFR